MFSQVAAIFAPQRDATLSNPGRISYAVIANKKFRKGLAADIRPSSKAR